MDCYSHGKLGSSLRLWFYLSVSVSYATDLLAKVQQFFEICKFVTKNLQKYLEESEKSSTFAIRF